MANKRRSFTTEFKNEAAALVVHPGYSVSEACRSLGIGETALRRWISQLEQERRGVTPRSKALTAEQQRIQEVEEEKEILKKATALLMSDELDHTR